MMLTRPTFQGCILLETAIHDYSGCRGVKFRFVVQVESIVYFACTRDKGQPTHNLLFDYYLLD